MTTNPPVGPPLLTAELARRTIDDGELVATGADFYRAVLAVAEGRAVVVPAPDQNLAGRGRGE